jgi:hypothetical protein
MGLCLALSRASTKTNSHCDTAVQIAFEITQAQLAYVNSLAQKSPTTAHALSCVASSLAQAVPFLSPHRAWMYLRIASLREQPGPKESDDCARAQLCGVEPRAGRAVSVSASRMDVLTHS